MGGRSASCGARRGRAGLRIEGGETERGAGGLERTFKSVRHIDQKACQIPRTVAVYLTLKTL